MTQIVVSLENGADTSLLQRMIENMKGVLKTSIITKRTASEHEESEQSEAWINAVHSIKKSIDPSLIDINDERTRYIMSK